MTSPCRASQSINQPNERTHEWKESNPPLRARARVGVSRRNAQNGRLALQSSAESHTVYTYDKSSPGFFSRVFRSLNLEPASQRSERTNAEGRMNSEDEQSEENIKQEVKPENHLNIKVRDTVRGISRRRVVD